MDKKEIFSSLGIGAKGIVYLLIGSLTAFAAFGIVGQKAGSQNALEFISEQTFGKILLFAIAVALSGYVFWRWNQSYRAIKSDGKKSKLKSIVTFGSGLFYLFLVYTSLTIIFGNGSQSGSTGSLLVELFSSSLGVILACLVGVILFLKAAYEFYQVYSGKFEDKLNMGSLGAKKRKLLRRSGKIGLTARGIVSGFMGYMILKAAIKGNAENIGKKEVFSFIENEFGLTIMGVIAIGLAIYGIAMLIRARYTSPRDV